MNTGAIENPGLLRGLVREIGSQSVVLSVEAKSRQNSSGEETWQCLTNFGRDQSGLEVKEWVSIAQDIGVREVLVTSVDKDGTKRGVRFEFAATCGCLPDCPLSFLRGNWEIKSRFSGLSHKRC